ncbi:uncharacterized protein LOC131334723 isoform X2 [Rhododendron vialii]|uniref:uncharacterized protein LOC131334723 isoform X2 n=1 Tax=Rhododendron vialii TaxID=182163 RepID=UPI00265E73E4|nr:uncharacterized protein LOC131334723 isoform X2 [Rhododendron vialii]
MTWTTSSHSLLLLPLASFVGPSISFVLSPLHCKSGEFDSCLRFGHSDVVFSAFAMAALLHLWLLAFLCFCTSMPSIAEEKKGNSKNLGIHKPLIFYCECFHVARVTGYQELIYQAIEAFEDLLFSEEESKKNEKGRALKKGLVLAYRGMHLHFLGVRLLSHGQEAWLHKSISLSDFVGSLYAIVRCC